jgi:hypothetical protein
MRNLIFLGFIIAAVSLGLSKSADWTALLLNSSRAGSAPNSFQDAGKDGVALDKVIRSRSCLLRRLIDSPLLESRSPADIAAVRPSLLAVGRGLGAVVEADARSIPGHAAAAALRRAATLASRASRIRDLEDALRTLEIVEREVETGPVGPRLGWRDYLAPIAAVLRGVAAPGSTRFHSPAAELLVLQVAAQGLSLGLSGLSSGTTALPPRVAMTLDVIGADVVEPIPATAASTAQLIREHRGRLLLASTALTQLLTELEMPSADPARALEP